MAIVKCLQLPGLANLADPTCKSTLTLGQIASFAKTLPDATADLVIWTRYVMPYTFRAPCANIHSMNSVESKVVILASCIPTLQPLLEGILGKRSLSGVSKDYHNSSE